MNPTAALLRCWGIRAVVKPLGKGHINDTYLASIPHTDSLAGAGALEEACAEPSSSLAAKPPNRGAGRWVLQRINQRVFHNPRLLMEHVAAASAHLNRKRPGWTPALMPTTDGRWWAELDGEVWRLWSYIKGRSLSCLANDAQAEAAGRAFGRTRRWLQDIAGMDRREVIPGFLKLRHYLAAYDAGPRAEPQLAAFIDARRGLSDCFRQPNGYIHGDCKVDNLVFDDGDEVVAVLDLDTVMRGHWAWEFGDLARAALDGAVRPSRFGAVAKGYVAQAGVPAQAEDLVLAPRYVTFMLGVRFLADHLLGNRYFKVAAPGENRERAQAQFRLLEALEAEQSALRDCAAEVLAESA